MASFIFKSLRIKTELTASVSLQDIDTGEILPGSSTGTVVDFSKGGMCIILTRIMLNDKHLFFSTLDSDRHNLHICLETQDNLQDKHEITARSIWMNSGEYKGNHVFRIGAKFLQTQQNLLTLLRK